jgi:DNA polymerase-3 subunit alpha
VEKLGLVKLDALGLKTMDVLHQTIINMGLDPKDQLDFIPLKDPPTYRALSNGDSDGVFQFEGGAMRRGIREVKPKNIEDLVASVALFRPATMNNGGAEQFVNRRHKRESIPTRHPLLMNVTKSTQGILLYQEQMIQVLRALGMEADELTMVLKAIKASNGNVTEANTVLHGVMDHVKQLSVTAGLDDDDIRFLESALLGYAEYGFNRSHAVVYGITGYRCAWLATNHAVEFYAALLSVASGDEKEGKYASAARKHGVRIMKPEINKSGIGYRPDGANIVRGFRSIDKLGIVAVTELVAHQPYTSLIDLAEKVNPRTVSGTRDLQKLIKAADGDDDALQAAFREHEFPGVIGTLKRAGAFRLMVKEEE